MAWLGGGDFEFFYSLCQLPGLIMYGCGYGRGLFDQGSILLRHVIHLLNRLVYMLDTISLFG